MKRISMLGCLVFAVASCCATAAAPITYVLQARTFAAAGTPGGTVAGATNATPIVITTSANHNLVSGDQVQVTGVGGNTNANTLAYAKVLSPTTFGLYSDVNLSSGIAGNSAYTSGGSVSFAFPVSQVSGDYTIKVRVTSLSSSNPSVVPQALITIQDSQTGFTSSDVVTQIAAQVSGPVVSSISSPITKSYRSYELPLLRIGVSGAVLRVNVQSMTPSTSVRMDVEISQ